MSHHKGLTIFSVYKFVLGAVDGEGFRYFDEGSILGGGSSFYKRGGIF